MKRQINQSLLIICLFFVSSPAVACFAWPDANKRMSNRDVVFTGIVEGFSCENGNRKVEFKTHKIWKGDNRNTYIVYIKGM